MGVLPGHDTLQLLHIKRSPDPKTFSLQLMPQGSRAVELERNGMSLPCVNSRLANATSALDLFGRIPSFKVSYAVKPFLSPISKQTLRKNTVSTREKQREHDVATFLDSIRAKAPCSTFEFHHWRSKPHSSVFVKEESRPPVNNEGSILFEDFEFRVQAPVEHTSRFTSLLVKVAERSSKNSKQGNYHWESRSTAPNAKSYCYQRNRQRC